MMSGEDSTRRRILSSSAVEIVFAAVVGEGGTAGTSNAERSSAISSTSSSATGSNGLYIFLSSRSVLNTLWILFSKKKTNEKEGKNNIEGEKKIDPYR